MNDCLAAVELVMLATGLTYIESISSALFLHVFSTFQLPG